MKKFFLLLEISMIHSKYSCACGNLERIIGKENYIAAILKLISRKEATAEFHTAASF